MTRKLGPLRWRRLHQSVYAIALLALIHYFQQTKADVTVPVFAASLFTWLIGYRAIAWWHDRSELSTLQVLALSLAVAVLTFFGEAVGIGIAFHVSPLRVLDTVFDFDAGIRPGWQVLAAGLAVVVLDAIRARWNGRAARGGAVAAE
jgi:sulfoxide reductase heme-binding subunit YedZ